MGGVDDGAAWVLRKGGTVNTDLFFVTFIAKERNSNLALSFFFLHWDLLKE